MSRVPAVAPVRKETPDSLHDWVEDHPAYASVQIGHIHGESGPMFGSKIPSNPGWIELSIHYAQRIHAHGEDRHFSPLSPIVSVRLTHAQWVELIANPNRGMGVPATLNERMRDDGKVDEIPEIALDQDETEGAEAIRDVELRGRKLAKEVRDLRSEIEAVLVEKKVPRKTIDLALEPVDRVSTTIGSSLPFYLSQVREAGEKIVSNVRIEAENIVSGIATRLGFATLKELQDTASKKQIEQK